MNARKPMNHFCRWCVVGLYAAAMAWVEAAVVFYLRTHLDRIQPYQANPLPEVPGFGEAELVRELATLVMIFSVGWLAGTSWRGRFGFMGVAFGMWDIFYYVFLKTMTAWPASLMDWDILFLLPLPWWGPVWSPVSIALLMILWGTLVTMKDRTPAFHTPSIWPTLVGCAGIALALYVFMADAIARAGEGVEALRALLPEKFNSPLFLLAWSLMAVPVIFAGRSAFSKRELFPT